MGMTFKDHKTAATDLYKDIADDSHDAVKTIGETLKDVGAQLQDKDGKQKPGAALADLVVGVAKAHAKFREGALDALSKALNKVRED